MGEFSALERCDSALSANPSVALMEARIKLHTRSSSKHLALGRVHGFDRDEAECQGYEGSVVLRGLLASECDAFEALEFADGLLDACPRLVEYFRKECRSIDRVDLYGMTGQMPRLRAPSRLALASCPLGIPIELYLAESVRTA